jgi:hypothetical protein
MRDRQPEWKALGTCRRRRRVRVAEGLSVQIAPPPGPMGKTAGPMTGVARGAPRPHRQDAPRAVIIPCAALARKAPPDVVQTGGARDSRVAAC